MTKEQEEAISRLRKITNRQILYGNKFGITIEGFREVQEDIETVLNMLKEKYKEIKKKDKIIDLLVNKLNQDCKVFENGEIKEIVEIYEKIKSTSDLRGIELRKECIKQYFERKATNDG